MLHLKRFKVKEFIIFSDYTTYMGFKENLREELIFQDVKIKELSQRTDISINTIRNYINGHNALPSIESGVKIAKALGVTAEYLVTGINRTENKNSIYEKLISDFKILTENDKKSLLALIAEMKTHY